VILVEDLDAARHAVDLRRLEDELARGFERGLIERRSGGLLDRHVFDVAVGADRDGQHHRGAATLLELALGIRCLHELHELRGACELRRLRLRVRQRRRKRAQ
jgi:hypothetical protein